MDWVKATRVPKSAQEGVPRDAWDLVKLTKLDRQGSTLKLEFEDRAPLHLSTLVDDTAELWEAAFRRCLKIRQEKTEKPEKFEKPNDTITS